MTSQDLNEIIGFIWFSYDFSKSARAVCFEKFGCENLGFLYVFVTSDFEILPKDADGGDDNDGGDDDDDADDNGDDDADDNDDSRI